MPVLKKPANLAVPLVGGGGTAVQQTPPNPVYQGQEVRFTIDNWPPAQAGPYTLVWAITTTPTVYTYGPDVVAVQDPNSAQQSLSFTWDTTDVEPGIYSVSVTITGPNIKAPISLPILNPKEIGPTLTPDQVTVRLRPIASGDTVPVAMMRTFEPTTSDVALWVAIRASANQLLFPNYVQFVDTIMCNAGSGMIDTAINNYLNDPTCLPPLASRGSYPFLTWTRIGCSRSLPNASSC